jgi:hypothetical protein
MTVKITPVVAQAIQSLTEQVMEAAGIALPKEPSLIDQVFDMFSGNSHPKKNEETCSVQ